MTGLLNFSASFINRKRFAISFRICHSEIPHLPHLGIDPFLLAERSSPVSPLRFAKPPIIALSSFTLRSPYNSRKHLVIFSIYFWV
jgi:hypothetical protein